MGGTELTRLVDQAKGRYRYWVGFNPIAVAWTAIGFLICTYAIPRQPIRPYVLIQLMLAGSGQAGDQPRFQRI